MKTRKNAIMRNGALVAVLLVVATLVMGCANASSGSGGTTALPANLKNTTWKGSGVGFIKFEEFIIKRNETINDFSEGKYSGFGVFAAEENGKIVVKPGDESLWKYQDEEIFCDSYSISGDKLTLTGGKYAGTYEKQ